MVQFKSLKYAQNFMSELNMQHLYFSSRWPTFAFRYRSRTHLQDVWLVKNILRDFYASIEIKALLDLFPSMPISSTLAIIGRRVCDVSNTSAAQFARTHKRGRSRKVPRLLRRLSVVNYRRHGQPHKSRASMRNRPEKKRASEVRWGKVRWGEVRWGISNTTTITAWNTSALSAQ